MHNYYIESKFYYKDYPCIVILSDFGYRCGYVGLSRDNKFYDMEYWKIPVTCHGGLTYGENCLVDEPDLGYYWIGFDCNHYHDGRDFEAIRAVWKDNPEKIEIYNTIYESEKIYNQVLESCSREYVEEECKSIVDQLITLISSNESIRPIDANALLKKIEGEEPILEYGEQHDWAQVMYKIMHDMYDNIVSIIKQAPTLGGRNE